jgi:uncharacterized membrane protein
MLAVRKVWMYAMLHRDFRVPDTMLMGQAMDTKQRAGVVDIRSSSD